MTHKPNAILCIDLDGTLIDSHQKVHPTDIIILQSFPLNVQPIITTGRNLHSAKGVLQENGLFLSDKLPLPGVFINGGVLTFLEKFFVQNTVFHLQFALN